MTINENDNRVEYNIPIESNIDGNFTPWANLLIKLAKCTKSIKFKS